MNVNDYHTITLNGVLYSSTTDFSKITSIHKDVALFLTTWFNPKENISLQTSGSTGQPKLHTAKKKYLLESAKSTCEYLKLTSNMNGLLCLPSKYIGGKMMIVRAIYAGFNLITTKATKDPLTNISEKIHFVAMTPYQFHGSIEHNKDKIANIDTIILGGSKVNTELVAIIKQLSNSVYETFGMTETYSHIALKNIKQDNYFNVLFPTSVSSQEELLTIHAPQLGLKELKTTDCIELIDAQTFKWLGRNDFVINSGGIKIHPETLEQRIAIENNIPIESIMITSIKDQLLGEKIVLLYTNNTTITFKSIEPYHIPKELYLLSSFIYTENGKINRVQTKEYFLTQLELSTIKKTTYEK